MVYSGGVDGSIYSWMIDEFDAPEIENEEEIDDDVYQEFDEEEDQFDEDIPHYIRQLEEEEYAAQEEERERVKADLRIELGEIKNKLEELLDQNQYADELEKLERDEFVIDVTGKESILKEGDEERKKMQEDAQKENMRNEILYNKIKETTYDTMEVQLKGVVGLKSNTVLYNFQIRKRTPEELRKLKLALDMRRLEQKERQVREEAKAKEVVNTEEFCKNPDQYIVNGNPGYKPLVLVDYEAKEDIPAPKAREEELDQGGRGRGGAKRKNRHHDDRRARREARSMGKSVGRAP